ncbi:cytochrome d ubiquinol oxidase subunit II [Paracidovorax cattleyae]|uniref:Cytochrome bd-I ubiquinol oxidase subunit 2 apoprotein n=1 Tax=Paracidovorax cattleyae TaxID=80868 RepID=A0A1H0V0D2_9BURK|nr:cytochrome d ubiquinol oxidase subunit II [Paracidovorax cattleyae]AVS74052.1 cytochrome d ubiquinol oxidase subunit II [Paracidovorax cattleyae]SDP71566.1 cytochrome bd-I ubiquinol oxidase subunit 2 apoprotein [Paracidovorax cattleyae]
MMLHTLLDYDTLRVIWWLLLGVLLVGFAVTDGFDLGVGTLLPFVARTDLERRVVINTVGPVWEGNQVWLILGGGAIFAAWPHIYAMSFSGFYLAMFATLFALILRPVGFKYRSKREGAAWRGTWDWALFIGGFVPSLIFGVALGNVLQGVPFRFTGDMRMVYAGSFLGLLNPFALLAGLVSVAMLAMHGGAWLALKTEGAVADRSRRFATVAALATIALYALAGVLLWHLVGGYQLTSVHVANGPSNPLAKTVASGVAGGWFANYASHPWTMLAPALGFTGALLALAGLRARWEGITVVFSGLSVAGIVLSVGASMFPFIVPSSLEARSSLMVWDASSSHLTLFIMLVCAAIFVPLILAYTGWVYRVMWGKVRAHDITHGDHAY